MSAADLGGQNCLLSPTTSSIPLLHLYLKCPFGRSYSSPSCLSLPIASIQVPDFCWTGFPATTIIKKMDVLFLEVPHSFRNSLIKKFVMLIAKLTWGVSKTTITGLVNHVYGHRFVANIIRSLKHVGSKWNLNIFLYICLTWEWHNVVSLETPIAPQHNRSRLITILNWQAASRRNFG